MRSSNLLDGAIVTAEGDDISRIICGDEVYLSHSNEITLDILLKEAREANVFALLEVYERGERITDFELSDADTGDMIAEGTSVGRMRTVRFALRKCKHLRLKIKGLAQITLASLALWKYDAPAAEAVAANGEDLMKMPSASKAVDGIAGYALLNFGGIYDFSRVKFKTEEPCEYAILAFDGSRFYKVLDGKAESDTVDISFPTVTGSYQIKIVSSKSFDQSKPFEVY